MSKKLSFSQAFKEGWECFIKYPLEIMGMVIIYAAINLVYNLLTQKLQGEFFILPIAQLIFLLLNTVMMAGIINITLSLLKGKKMPITAIFKPLPSYWKMVGAMAIIGLIAGTPLVIIVTVLLWAYIAAKTTLLIVFSFLALAALLWAITAALKLQYAYYALVEKNCKLFESISQSWKKTTGNFWKIVLLAIAFFFMNFGGILLFGIGIIFTWAVTLMVTAAAYRQLFD